MAVYQNAFKPALFETQCKCSVVTIYLQSYFLRAEVDMRPVISVNAYDVVTRKSLRLILRQAANVGRFRKSETDGAYIVRGCGQ